MVEEIKAKKEDRMSCCALFIEWADKMEITRLSLAGTEEKEEKAPLLLLSVKLFLRKKYQARKFYY